MKRFCLVLALVLLLPLSMARAEERSILLTFVGDCAIGSEDKYRTFNYSFHGYLREHGYAYFFEKVRDFLAEGDLTIANLEGVFSESKGGKRTRKFNFRGEPDFVQVLTEGGVDVVSLANNHALDYGEVGLERTKEALTGAGIHWFKGQEAYLYEKDGITIAFVGLCKSDYFVAGNEFYENISRLKEEGVNAVVCCLHFGQEYKTKHAERQTEMARRAIDAGADLVIGHHPHVVQGTEVYGNRTIVYSLGNFVFGGNVYIRTKFESSALQCLVARVELRFAGDGSYLGQQLKLYPAHISEEGKNNTYQPRLVTGEDAQAVFDLVAADSAAPILTYPVEDGALVFPYLDKWGRE